jgi:putative membrane protein
VSATPGASHDCVPSPGRTDGACRAPVLCLLFVCAAWLGNGLYAAGGHGGILKTWSPAIVASAMIGFVLVHGRHSGGWRSLLLFVTSVAVLGWTAESIGIVTGFPFGDYHYTDSMWPFIGHVPVAVLPAYCVMGYISWSMARILLHRVDGGVDRELLAKAPVVAAGLMVVWDVSMDPLRATVEQRWIWLDGGLHYGIPLTNFVGWFFVTWVMFQLYALLLFRFVRIEVPAEIVSNRQFWCAVPLMYLSFAVEYIGNPVVSGGHDIALTVNGTPIAVQRIHQEIAVIAAVTMLPAALLTVSRVKSAVTGAARRARETAR